jgi:hypothetical protein
MKYAWIENDKIRDIAHSNPSEIFHADVAKFYDTQVPDEAVNGQGWDGTNLIPIPVPEVVIPEPVPVVPPKVSVIEYKMLFTVQERIAIKTSTDAVIQDLYELLNDQRVDTVDLSLKSISDALDYMTALNILVVGRKAEILLGKVT